MGLGSPCSVMRAHSLDPYDHRIGPNQVFHARFAKARLAHPCATLGTRDAAAARRFHQHMKAHQQSKRVFAPVVVDEPFVDDQRATTRQRAIRFLDQCPFLLEVSVVENVARDQHIGRG